MKSNTVFVIGILGALLFAATCIVGGLLIDGYSVPGQYIRPMPLIRNMA